MTEAGRGVAWNSWNLRRNKACQKYPLNINRVLPMKFKSTKQINILPGIGRNTFNEIYFFFSACLLERILSGLFRLFPAYCTFKSTRRCRIFSSHAFSVNTILIFANACAFRNCSFSVLRSCFFFHWCYSCFYRFFGFHIRHCLLPLDVVCCHRT